MLRCRLLSATLVSALVGGITAIAAPADAVQTAQSTVVNAVPATYTPDANNGVTYAFGQVGSTIFAGGSFTNESPHGSTTVVSQPYMFGFTEGTGAVVTSFAPVLDGQVNTIAAGPAPNEVYAAGAFKTVNGVKERVALLDATTGQIVPGWKPAALNGNINRIELFNGQLIVGGYFSLANNAVARGGIVSLDANTGALTNFVANQFTGHHNYGTQCDPTKSTCASAGVGVKAFDISPDGTRLTAIGNFTKVDGLARDQAAVLDIGQGGTTVDPNWATLAFTAQCFSGAFDSYVRDVQYSPDGSYFVIVATGGSGTNTDGTNSSCDTAARYETSATGIKVRPTWIDYTGQDTFWSVAISGTAVYAGGHERWVNNSKGFDTSGAGSVPRPGIAAMDPQNGLPISWNPGRNPRGAGAYALLLTTKGLYVGSDTDYIGNYLYHHKKIAFFPLAGGKTLPANAIGSFPGKVYLVGGPTGTNNLRSLSWDGSSTPTGLSTFNAPGISWNVAHGAFYVNGNVYYGETDGYLHMRSFDGRTFGPDLTVDPYDDPYWSNVKTGSGGSTPYYRGKVSAMSSDMKNITSMFYSGGRIYYTTSTSSQMFWRWFEPESGVTGSDVFTTTDGLNWSGLSGAFLVGSTLYFAKSNSSSLQSVPFVNGQAAGTPTTANNTSGIDWRSAGAFVVAKSQVNNSAPTAKFTVNCDTTDTACTFDASGSTDSDGSVVQYDWNFGDGTTDSTGSSSEQHTFASPGEYTVSLTVTDNDGGTGSVAHNAVAGVAPAQPIAYIGSNHAVGNNATSVGTTIPASTTAGDALLLFESRASTTVGITPPAGWQLVGSTARSNLSTDVYERVATDSDAGSAVTVNFSGTVKSTIVVAAYSNTDPTTPVENAASATSTASATVTAPAMSGLADGTFIVRIYGDKSSATTGWTAPADTTTREVVLGTGTGTVNDLLVDSNGAVGSSVGADAATTNDTSGSEAAWTVALKQVTAG